MVSWTVIEILMNGSNLTNFEMEEIKERLFVIDSNWNEFNEMEYYVILDMLKLSQVDKISNGMNYSQTEIINHLRKLA